MRSIESKRMKRKSNPKDINRREYSCNLNNISPHKDAMIVTSIYGMFGILWIALSDQLLSFLVINLSTYKQIQTYKGWAYVVITIGLLYILVRKRSSLIKNTLIEMNHAYEEIQTTYEELVATEEELMDQKKFNEHIFMDAHVIIGTWDEHGCITSLNPFGRNLLGYTEVEIVGKKWLDLLISEANKSNMVNDFKRIEQGRQHPNHESQFVTKEGKKIDIIWNSSLINYQNQTSEILSIGTDITERKILEEKLKNIAYSDPLTGLPNRTLIEDEVKKLIDRNLLFALIHIDLDNFKQINDTLGHLIGDQFLLYGNQSKYSK